MSLETSAPQPKTSDWAEEYELAIRQVPECSGRSDDGFGKGGGDSCWPTAAESSNMPSCWSENPISLVRCDENAQSVPAQFGGQVT